MEREVKKILRLGLGVEYLNFIKQLNTQEMMALVASAEASLGGIL